MSGSIQTESLLCPTCRVDLVMSGRQGIEIDYCPRCRGVWLDRGELDKIIERSAGIPAARETLGISRQSHDGHGGGSATYETRGHHRRKSFLRNLFD